MDYITNWNFRVTESKFSFKNWEGRPRILDHEIGSLTSDSIKKACQTTQHYSEISLGAKLIVAKSRNIASEVLVNIDSGNGFLLDGTNPLPETMYVYHQ